MSVLVAKATLITMLSGATLVAAQWWWPFGSDEQAESAVEIERLRTENESLVQENEGLVQENAGLARENARLTAANQEVRERLIGTEPLAVELERVTGERDRALIDLAAARATGEQLERALANARETVARQEGMLRNVDGASREGVGWVSWMLAFLVLVVLVLVLVVARERSWSWRFLTARRVSDIPEGSRSVARPVASAPPVRTTAHDRSAQE